MSFPTLLLAIALVSALGASLSNVVAAVSIVPVALWHQAASQWFADMDFHERWGSLLAATALFFLPSMLLGMVSPYAVRLVARRLSSVGTSAGALYGISTMGSFLGCLLTAFYFILWMGIRHILLLSAVGLFLVAVWLLAVWYAGGPAQKKEPPE